MADNSWMLPPKLRYKQRRFGCKEADMLMMCNKRSQEAELQRRYQRLNVAYQDFLRKYRHEVWEVRHFLRNIGRIERQNRVLLPTEKYEEDIFNAKLRAHNLKKRKRQERQQVKELLIYPSPHDNVTTIANAEVLDDSTAHDRLADMMDRSLSLTSFNRKMSTVAFEDPNDGDLDSLSPDFSRRPVTSVGKKRRKTSSTGGRAAIPPVNSGARRTPTGLDPIPEGNRPSLRTRTSQEQLTRTQSTISPAERELVTIVPLRVSGEGSSLTHTERHGLIHLPKIETGEVVVTL